MRRGRRLERSVRGDVGRSTGVDAGYGGAGEKRVCLGSATKGSREPRASAGKRPGRQVAASPGDVYYTTFFL